MNLENIFKRTILIYALSEIIAIVFQLTLEGRIIGEEYVKINSDLPSFYGDSFLFTALIFGVLGVLIVHLISLYLLYKFKPIGKQIYVYSLVIVIIFLLPFFHDISSGPMYVIDLIGTILSGIILSFLYFTPIKDKFK